MISTYTSEEERRRTFRRLRESWLRAHEAIGLGRDLLLTVLTRNPLHLLLLSTSRSFNDNCQRLELGLRFGQSLNSPVSIVLDLHRLALAKGCEEQCCSTFGDRLRQRSLEIRSSSVREI